MTIHSSSPSFLGMKKIGETKEEVPCRIYPFARSSWSAWRNTPNSLVERGYTLQSSSSGAPSLRLIDMSSFRLGGSCFASSSEKTLACNRYFSDIPLSLRCSFFLLSVAAHCCAKVSFLIKLLNVCPSWRHIFHLCSQSLLGVIRIRFSGNIIPVSQLIVGLNSRRNGNPNTALSCPRSVTKKSTILSM